MENLWGVKKMNALKYLILGVKQKNDSDIGKLIQRKKEIQSEIRGLMKDRREIEASIEKALVNREEAAQKEQIEKKGQKRQKEQEKQRGQIRQEGQKEEKRQKKEKLPHKKEETSGTASPIRKEETISPVSTTFETGPFSTAEKEKIFHLSEGLEISRKVEVEKEKEPFLEPIEKTKLSNSLISGTQTKDNNSPQRNGKTEEKKDAGSLFGNNLLEELLNDEDLNTEEEQSFLKFLETPGASELVEELKGIRKCLAGECF